MQVGEFLVMLLVAAIIGALGQAIAGYSTPGCAMSIVIGFVGALLGRWAQKAFALPNYLPLKLGGTSFPIVWSILGSAVFVLVLRLILSRSNTSGNTTRVE